MHHRTLDDSIEANRRFGLDGLLPGTGENDLLRTSSRSRPSCGRSTLQLPSNWRACGSSMSAYNRCSSPTRSCRRSAASRNARRMLSSVSGAKGTGYDHARCSSAPAPSSQAAVPVLFREAACRIDLGLGHVTRVDACNPQSRLVYAHHHGNSLCLRLVENRLENPDDEFLGGVIVIVQQDPPHDRPLHLLDGPAFGQDRFIGCGTGHTPIVPSAFPPSAPACCPRSRERRPSRARGPASGQSDEARQETSRLARASQHTRPGCPKP